MPRDSVDTLIEDLFGHKSNKAPEKPPEAPKTPPKARTTAPSADTPEDQERAARVVHAAAVAHTGKLRPVESWRSMAAEALGIKRLVQARWEGVLAKGVEIGLFTIDETSHKYPVLVPVLESGSTPGVPIQADEAEVEEFEAEDPSPEQAPRERNTPPPKAELPPNWNPPSIMDCGHMTWWQVKSTDAEGNVVLTCDGCAKRVQPYWSHLKGVHRRPLPPMVRRTAEKVRMGGFPGYCCDDEGYYIGGDGNNCQEMHPKDPAQWCKYHRDEYEDRIATRQGRKKKEPEPDDESYSSISTPRLSMRGPPITRS